MPRSPSLCLLLPLALLLLGQGCASQKNMEVSAPEPAPVAAAAPEPSPQVPKPDAGKRLALEGERCEHAACFRKAESFHGTDFVLQGISLRKYLWVNVYTAALYLPGEAKEFRHGVPAGAKLIVLEYHRPIEKKKIAETIESKVYALPYVNGPAVRERFDTLTAAFEPPVDGSRYYFLYVPERGTALIQGGRETVLLAGEDFADAFFGVWLYEKEPGPMRAELLGDQ